jgi:tetratricopeptide (TPR) repeat protein
LKPINNIGNDMSQVDGSNENESAISPISNGASAGLILHQSNSLLRITDKIISSDTEKIHDALNLKGIPTPSNYEIVPKDDHLQRGKLFMWLNLYKKANREFTFGIEKEKGDLISIYYNRGCCRKWMQVNSEGAISDLLKSIQIGLNEIHEIKNAEEYIDFLKSWSSNLREQEKRLINFIYRDEKWEEGQTEFTKLAQKSKAYYYYRLGTCRKLLGDYENAINNFETAKSLGYDFMFNNIEECKDETFESKSLYSEILNQDWIYGNIENLFNRISILVDLQEYEVALKLIDQHFPEKGFVRESAFLLRGVIKEIAGDIEAALSDYNQGQIDSCFWDAKLGSHYFGVLLYNQKRYSEAEAFLSEALVVKTRTITGLKTEKQKIFFGRALTRHRLKKYQEAVEDYTSAVKIEPANPLFYLGRYYSKFLSKQSTFVEGGFGRG